MSENENSAEEFDLSISGDGINVERKIDSKTLAAILALAIGTQRADDATSPIPRDVDVTSPLPEIPMSLREYLDKVGASRKPDQIIAIGHFISHYEHQSDFSRDEIRSRFSIAREPMPKNFSRDINLAIKAGMLAKVHQKPGYYYVTKAGISAIERHFTKIEEKK